MKQLITGLSLLMMALGASAQTDGAGVSSLDFEAGGITYTILDQEGRTCQTKSGSSHYSYEDRKLIVEYGNTVTGDVVIPAAVERNNGGVSETYLVVGIGDYAFNNASSISIPQSVTKIGTAAFSTNTKLTKVDMGNAVTTIGTNAFAECTSLTSINLSSSLTAISKHMFSGCSNLTEITIPESVTQIDEYAFSYCRVLKSVTLPNSVVTLGSYAFTGCTSLSEVNLSENLTSLPAYAFYMNISLKSITLPASLSSIGDAAFLNCNNLKDVTCYEHSLPAVSQNSFGDAAYSGKLTIYKSMQKAFMSSPIWKNFQNIEFIPVAAEFISLNKPTLSISVGMGGQLEAVISPADATEQVVWSVVDVNPENAISVSETGRVAAQRMGTGRVKATCGTVSAYCNVTVTNNPKESVTISPIGRDVYVGDEVLMSAVVIPTTITGPITWSTSNPEVATIDETTGLLRAVSPGGALITAQCEGMSGKLSVTVLPIPASSVTLNMTELTLKAGMSQAITATVAPANTTYPDVTWETSDPNVATVSGGVITANGVGSCVIRAMCGDAMANCVVTVEETLPETVILSSSALSMKPGQNSQLTATVLPVTTTDATVIWISNNPEVVTVSADGTVTAIGVGSTTITATCGNVSSSCFVTVEPITASEVVLNYTALSLLVNQSQQLTAMVADDVTDKTINWISSDPNVATVTDGLVVAKGVGVASIVATCGEAVANCIVVVNPIPVESLTINSSINTINVGNTLTLDLTINPEDATDPKISWASSNAAVASVVNGIVSAYAPGSVTITASCGSVSASYNLTVLQPATSLTLNYETLTLELGDMEDIIATVLPSNTTDQVFWSVLPNNVATVNEQGIVQATRVGETTVTAYCGSLTASCKVIVTPVYPTKVTLNTKAATLNVSESLKLTASVEPDNVTNGTVNWRSSDIKVATVDSQGNVKAIAPGKATITATCVDMEATCEITVVAPDPKTLVMSYAEVNLHATETFKLSATVGGETGNYNFNWNSSNTKVATVDQTGLVTAVEPGTATITVSYEGMSATCNVTVTKTLATIVILDPTSLSMRTGELASLNATVYPNYTTDKTLTWVSDNEAVATVDENGIVNAVAEGYAVITVYCGNVFAQCNVTVENPQNDQPGGDNPGEDNPGGDNPGEDNPGGDNPGSGGEDNPGGDNPGEGDNGVEAIVDDAVTYNVFNLNGFKVMTTTNRDDLQKLEKGLYIINGKKVYINKF